MMKRRDALKLYPTLWTSIVIISVINYYDLVPIAPGKYLFPFRTQKSSLVAPIILRKRETRKVPNYKKPFVTTDGFFLFKNNSGPKAGVMVLVESKIFTLCLGGLIDNHAHSS